VFQLAGGRQQDVGIVGGVGLEQFVYDAEQVFACKTGAHPVRVRCDGDRIGVVHHDCADRRIVRFEQGIADGAHVDVARREAFVIRIKVRAFQRVAVGAVGARGR